MKGAATMLSNTRRTVLSFACRPEESDAHRHRGRDIRHVGSLLVKNVDS